MTWGEPFTFSCLGHTSLTRSVGTSWNPQCEVLATWASWTHSARQRDSACPLSILKSLITYEQGPLCFHPALRPPSQAVTAWAHLGPSVLPVRSEALSRFCLMYWPPGEPWSHIAPGGHHMGFCKSQEEQAGEGSCGRHAWRMLRNPSGVQQHTHLSFRPNLAVGLRHLLSLQCLEEKAGGTDLLQKRVGSAARKPPDSPGTGLHHPTPASGSQRLSTNHLLLSLWGCAPSCSSLHGEVVGHGRDTAQ